MRNLFLFFREHYFYFLFLLLETFSLVLLFNYNEFQGSSLYAVSNNNQPYIINVSLYNVTPLVTAYFFVILY